MWKKICVATACFLAMQAPMVVAQPVATPEQLSRILYEHEAQALYRDQVFLNRELAKRQAELQAKRAQQGSSWGIWVGVVGAMVGVATILLPLLRKFGR
ncbi:hypothetical protein NXS99_09100 [Corynebacterium sp. HS2168-gen11]|nr:hypothetical protein [Corynebacterium sp. HS2168-gen11]